MDTKNTRSRALSEWLIKRGAKLQWTKDIEDGLLGYYLVDKQPVIIIVRSNTTWELFTMIGVTLRAADRMLGFDEK
jgi:hypothetical protein